VKKRETVKDCSVQEPPGDGVEGIADVKTNMVMMRIEGEVSEEEVVDAFCTTRDANGPLTGKGERTMVMRKLNGKGNGNPSANDIAHCNRTNLEWSG